MAFREVRDKLKFPKGASPRYKQLAAYRRMLDGTFYDDLAYPFSQEFDGSHYVEVYDRRPSSRYDLPRIITDQTAGLLFGDEQSPLVKLAEDGADPSDDEQAVEKLCDEMSAAYDLDSVMLEAYEAGQVGSCAIVIRRTANGTPDFDIVGGEEATVEFDPLSPSTVVLFTHLYPLTGAELFDPGSKEYREKKDIQFWLKLEIDKNEERRYKPLPWDEVEKLGEQRPDGSIISWTLDQTYRHSFGLVPVVWIRNSVKRARKIDGPCTWGAVVDNIVEIDYCLSKITRGYHYTADPLIFINNGEMANLSRDPGRPSDGATTVDGRSVKTPGMMIERSGPSADAKILETTGTAFAAASEWLDKLREWSLEVLGGMKASAKNEHGAQSGRSLELLYQVILLLVKRQRLAYGRNGLLPLVQMLKGAIDKGVLTYDDQHMRLLWPSWMTPRGADLVALANAAETLAGGSPKAPVIVLPPDTVSRYVASEMGFKDPNSIAKTADQARQEAQQRADDQAAQELAAKQKQPTGAQR